MKAHAWMIGSLILLGLTGCGSETSKTLKVEVTYDYGVIEANHATMVYRSNDGIITAIEGLNDQTFYDANDETAEVSTLIAGDDLTIEYSGTWAQDDGNAYQGGQISHVLVEAAGLIELEISVADEVTKVVSELPNVEIINEGVYAIQNDGTFVTLEGLDDGTRIYGSYALKDFAMITNPDSTMTLQYRLAGLYLFQPRSFY